MNTYIVEHKYIKATKTIKGATIWDALRENGLDSKIWKIMEV